jgi:DeoR/GlpR family transcriptional regulator of sugar metabolism
VLATYILLIPIPVKGVYRTRVKTVLEYLSNVTIATPQMIIEATNEDLQSLCPGISRETLRKDLNYLIAKNVIIRKGIKRGAFYVLK